MSIYAKCSIFLKLAFLSIFIHLSTSAPFNTLTENAYTQFIAEINRNKCSVPSQVQLPFDTTKVDSFEYLSSYLGICQKTEQTKRNREAVVLCKEIFDNIRNISCPTPGLPKTALPDISVNLSGNVCQDIGALEDSVPDDDKSLLKRLTDGFLCDIMCDSEFEKACQVLLWSFEVRKQIASVANAQESEQPNVPEEGDLNDNAKQDNAVDENTIPQNGINTEIEKKNAEEAKSLNGHDEMPEQPDPSLLVNNLEQKPIAVKVIHSGNAKKEIPASNNKETTHLENQKVPEAGTKAGALESTSSLKASSTLSSLQTSVVTSSNTEVKPKDETAKDGANVQTADKILPGNNSNLLAVKHEEVDGGEKSSQGSMNATDEQPRDAADTLAGKDVQNNKDADGQLPDNSKTPANQNVPLNPNANEIPDEIPQNDRTSDFQGDDGLPHESGNEENPHDEAHMHDDEQQPENLVNKNPAQNKPDTPVMNDGSKLLKETDVHTTSSQTVKETTLPESTQEVTKDKTTSVAREETKADQPPTNSKDSTKKETPDSIDGGLVPDDTLADQKKPSAPQPADERENTIPDATPEEKTPEKSADATNPEVKSSVTETSTKTTVALEKMEGGSDLRRPAGEDTDHYTDLENTEDDEYSRPDLNYEGGLYGVSKSKESNPTVALEPSPNERTIDFPPRNPFGQDIQMIAAFPEQEDSHFFFYFLSIVLILMAGYLVFHNKQKIIALIVEGRHERNRRSHRIGYKKLETK